MPATQELRGGGCARFDAEAEPPVRLRHRSAGQAGQHHSRDDAGAAGRRRAHKPIPGTDRLRPFPVPPRRMATGRARDLRPQPELPASPGAAEWAVRRQGGEDRPRRSHQHAGPGDRVAALQKGELDCWRWCPFDFIDLLRRDRMWRSHRSEASSRCSMSSTMNHLQAAVQQRADSARAAGRGGQDEVMAAYRTARWHVAARCLSIYHVQRAGSAAMPGPRSIRNTGIERAKRTVERGRLQ